MNIAENTVNLTLNNNQSIDLCYAIQKTDSQTL